MFCFCFCDVDQPKLRASTVRDLLVLLQAVLFETDDYGQ
jgi:hypothetical protein